METFKNIFKTSLVVLLALILGACSTESKLTIEGNRTSATGLAILSGSEKPGDFEALMMAKINYLRKKGHICHDQAFEPSDDLVWNVHLSGAAKSHVKDLLSMDADGTIDIRSGTPPHLGSDDKNVAYRVTNQGYEFNTIAENLASTANGAMAMHATYLSWLASKDGHCEVLVRDDLTEVGLYYEDGVWAAVFGSPKATK